MLRFSRRSFLAASTGIAWSQSRSPVCALTPEQEQGPYYIDDRLVRRDITEGKPGVPLDLRVVVLDARNCRPLENAAIDIWHCDAAGVYSGFTAMNGAGPRGGPPPGMGPGMFDPRDFGPPPGGPPPSARRHTDATRYLRGVQLTDTSGRAEFATLYPGWYFGRAIHIHLKVHVNNTGHVCHTGQLFFPEEITSDVAKLEPYSTRTNVHRTSQDEDGVFRGQHGDATLMKLDRLEARSNAGGFLATIALAVDPEATPAPVGFGPPGRFSFRQ